MMENEKRGSRNEERGNIKKDGMGEVRKNVYGEEGSMRKEIGKMRERGAGEVKGSDGKWRE